MSQVFVALSGGSDSSFCSYLLKEKGYEVSAVVMDIGYGSDVIDDAKFSSVMLNIPLFVFKAKDLFRKRVIEYFIGEYLRGRTPNPCAICNRYVKFGKLMDFAISLGAQYFCTGHYCRVVRDKEGISVLKGVDENKDQSYFLSLVDYERFERVLFPLGDFNKKDVMEIARGLGITKAEAESQDICFLKGKSYRDFLKEMVGERRGYIVDIKGRRLGEHNGFYFYTIGQRRGLGLSFGYPVYVVDIIPDDNLVVVGDEKYIFYKKMKVKDINWLCDREKLLFPLSVKVKIRRQHIPADAFIFEDGIVEFKVPQRAITPGQIAAFYQGNRLLGGGIIDAPVS